MRTAVRNIEYSENLRGPAKINFRTGKMTVNPDRMKSMTPDQRKFVILHEAGHAANKNSDEFAADRYALRHASKNGLSPRRAVLALVTTLNPNNPKHVARVNALYNEYELMTKRNNEAHYVGDNYEATPQRAPEADFFGLTKKSRARIAQRRENRHQRKLEKIELKQASKTNRTALRTAGGQSLDKIIAASGDALGSALSVVPGLGGSLPLIGGLSGGDPYLDEDPPKDNTMLIIVVVAVVALVGFFIWKRNH